METQTVEEMIAVAILRSFGFRISCNRHESDWIASVSACTCLTIASEMLALQSASMPNHLNRHHRKIISNRRLEREVPHVLDQPAHDCRGGQMSTVAQKHLQPVAVLLICAIPRFRQAVSIQKQTITFRELEMRALVTLLTKHSNGQSRRRYWRCDSIMHEQ